MMIEDLSPQTPPSSQRDAACRVATANEGRATGVHATNTLTAATRWRRVIPLAAAALVATVAFTSEPGARADEKATKADAKTATEKEGDKKERHLAPEEAAAAEAEKVTASGGQDETKGDAGKPALLPIEPAKSGAAAKDGAIVDKKAQEKAAAQPKIIRPVTVDKRVSPNLKRALVGILQDEALEGAEVSFSVASMADGQLLAASDPDRKINPASNAKMPTAAAALSLLRPEFRFKTEYYTRGRVKDGVLWGDLVVKGYGDPSVVSERLMRVANEIYLLGIERIRGAIVVDDTYFDNDQEARGWELEENPDRAYAAPVSAVNLNFNAIGVHIRPGAKGEMATVQLDPPVGAATLEGEVETKRWARRLRIYSKADSNGTLIQVSGAVGYRDRARRWYRRVYDPSKYFGSALAYFLRQRGVRVRDRIVKAPVPPGSRLIHIDFSPRLTHVVSDLNHYSNNFVAETLVKTIAAETTGKPGTFKVGLQLVAEYLENELGFKRGSFVYGNGSGLNDVNRFTSRQLVRLMHVLANDFEIGPEFVTSLAVAGTQGTIGFRMRDGPAERRLRAKTGTLRGVSALSGYVVAPNNEVLAFSILSQGFKGPTSSIWNVQNAIGEALASNGATYMPVAPQSAPAVSAAPGDRGDQEPQKGGNP